METLTSELLRCIYKDYTAVIEGSRGSVDARVLFKCSPYFDSLKAVTMHRDELMDELQVYNDGVDLRKALVKCSVGVKTMFNDARRAIRDMIFKVWANYVRSRSGKALRLKKRIGMSLWFRRWKSRWQRFKEHGYFYDSESETESDLSEDEEEGRAREPSFRTSFAQGIGGMAAIAENPESSYSKIVARMNHSPSPTLSDVSEKSKTSDSSGGSNDRLKSNSLGLAKFKGAVHRASNIGAFGLKVKHHNNHHFNLLHHRTLKIIKEEKVRACVSRSDERKLGVFNKPNAVSNAINAACRTRVAASSCTASGGGITWTW